MNETLPLWDIHTHTVTAGQRNKLPLELQSGTFYAFTAYGAHWDAKRRDYLHVTFTEKCKVYLLFVNKARVPPWVKSKGFRPVRECKLEVDWELELAFKIIAVMTKRLEECRTAKMQLYESDTVYEPGVTHTFGGMSGKQLLDYTYVFMWRRLTDKELSGSAAADEDKKKRRDTENGDGDDASNRQRREDICRDIVKYVDKGDLELVRRNCEAYRELLAKAQPAAEGAQPAAASAAATAAAAAAAASSGGSQPPVAKAAAGAPIRAPAAMRWSSHEPAESGTGPLHTDGDYGGRWQLPSSADGTAAAGGGTVAPPGAHSERLAARPAADSHTRSAFVTRSGKLLTSLAIKVDNCDPRLVLYLVAQGAEINSEVLRYILDNVKELPSSGYASVGHFMLSYIWHQRNPIACSMVMAQHLLDISSQHTTKNKEFRDLGQKLQKLAAHLVEKLDRLVGSSTSIKEDEEGQGEDGSGKQKGAGEAAQQDTGNEEREGPGARSLSGRSSTGEADQGRAISLEDVLAPRGVALSINDAQPMQVAYDMQDDEFMSTGVVQEYCKAHWQGAAYIANALVEVHGESAVHMRDNRTVFKLFMNAGFVGSLGEPFMLMFSRMAHILILALRPYFDSPRGRWAFRMMCEGILLYVFHAVQLLQSEDGLTWQHLVLTLYVLSMVVDEVQEVAHKYQRRLAVYFTDGFNVIEAITILLLLASGGCKIGMMVVGTSDPAWGQLRTAKDFLFNTTAICLWLRAVQVLLPLVGGLGVLLMVTSKMVWEVLKFAVLGMMVMIGVAFTMYGMYKDREVPAMDSFANVLLLLFRTFLGETMFDVMLTEKSTLYNLYGNIVVLMYTLAATVILANLLIAIISYHYKPEKVSPQSKFQDAEILQQYEYRVTHHLIGAPFSLPLLIIKELLPSGSRCMLNEDAQTFLFAIGILQLDGNPLPDQSYQSTYQATGSAELPYLIFLLTFYPMLIAATCALGLVMAPYCIFYFAVKGCNGWLSDEFVRLTTPWMLASKAGGAKGSPRSGGDPSAEGSRTKVAPAPAEDDANQQQELLLDALDEDDAVADGAHNLDSQQKDKGRSAAHGVSHMLQLALLPLQCVLFVAVRLFVAGVGAFIYVVVLIGFCTIIWLGIYQFFARTFFSCFWVLHGWVQGWFGSSGLVDGSMGGGRVAGASSDGHGGKPPGGSSTGGAVEAGAMARHTSTHVLDRRWVRSNQAALKDRGQVLMKDEIEAAMKEAGFSEEEVKQASQNVDSGKQPAK